MDLLRSPAAEVRERAVRLVLELERENRELKRANEILRKASAYFAQTELAPSTYRDHKAVAGEASDSPVGGESVFTLS